MASRLNTVEPRPAPRLYLVTPPLGDPQGLLPDLARAFAAADIAAVLLRLSASDDRTLINRIKAIAGPVQDAGAALLLDGHPDLVARGGADGAHLTGIGPFNDALATLKPDRIAGAGGLASRHDAMLAAEAGADYVMFGEPIDGDERPAAGAIEERVAWWAEVFEAPCVGFAGAIGEVAPLVAAGADFIALDFVWTDPRGIATALAEAMQAARLPETAG
jgi:thiamine-phosphate pyrophosphorylase